MGSHEDATICKHEENERIKGEGGGRQKLRHVDGDVPLCIRKKMTNVKQKWKTKRRWKKKAEGDRGSDTLAEMRSITDEKESKSKAKDQGSSSNTEREGSSKKREKKEADNESRGLCGSSTEEKKATREAAEEKNITFVVLQKNVRSLNSSDRVEELIRNEKDADRMLS